MKKYITLLFMLGNLFILSEIYAGESEEHTYVGSNFRLSPEKLEELTKKGLAGDSNAGSQVWLHYAFGNVYDETTLDKALIWSELLAESDLAVSQWNLASIYSMRKNDYKIRAIYWCFLSAKGGEKYAQAEIEMENLSLESPYPAVAPEVFNKENSQLTDDELVALTDHALRGGKNEAYKLFEYHRDYKHDEKTAYYWLRIAAQNYDVRSQYEYGKYLLASDDEYEKIRGGFWIRKAAKSGNADAKKLAETLGSETQ